MCDRNASINTLLRSLLGLLLVGILLRKCYTTMFGLQLPAVRGSGKIFVGSAGTNTVTLVGAVSSLEALSWPCPSPDQAPGETPGSVRRATQRRRHGVVLSLETLRGCLGCLAWRSSWCGCLVCLGHAALGAMLSRAGCCRGHGHPGRNVLHLRRLF